MLLSALLAGLLSADPCTISGKVSLLRDGKVAAGEADRVAVYIDYVPGPKPNRASKTHFVFQRGKAFVPPVLVVTAGDKVTFTNQDKVEHSVFSNTKTGAFYDPPSTKDATGTHVFTKPGPVLIQCDLHHQMRADILVVANPFATLANADGTFQISGLPAGPYTLVAWEPNGGKVRAEVSCAGQATVNLQVEEAAKPTLKRKDETDYGEYE